MELEYHHQKLADAEKKRKIAQLDAERAERERLKEVGRGGSMAGRDSKRETSSVGV